MTKTVLVVKNLQGLGLVGDGLNYITGSSHFILLRVIQLAQKSRMTKSKYKKM